MKRERREGNTRRSGEGGAGEGRKKGAVMVRLTSQSTFQILREEPKYVTLYILSLVKVTKEVQGVIAFLRNDREVAK